MTQHIRALGLIRFGLVALAVTWTATGALSREKSGPQSIDWDQVENIKSAAARIGRVQRARGAEVAMTLIANCYKTHTLFEKYSRGFESCLVQDHLETRVLLEVYGRMQPDALRRMGAPSQESLMRSNIERFSATLSKYKFPASYAMQIRKLTDKHGWPVFLKIVFPNVGKAGAPKRPPRKRLRPKKR